MGSFFGHALPGTFFLFFAVWWMIQAFRRYFQSMMKNGAPFVATPTFTVQIRGRQRNVEAAAVTIMAALGIFVELVLASIKDGHMVGAGNFQHSTMYFFFGMVGVMSLTLPRLGLFPNHQDVVYVFLALAYVVEGLLFKFHLFGRDSVDVLLHTLLVYSIFACAAATMLEMRYRENVLCVLGRAFFTILQGTWFWQAAWLLYNPAADMAWGGGHNHHDDHGDHGDATPAGGDEHGSGVDPHDTADMHQYMMLVTCAFIWHMAAILLLMLATGAFIGCFYRRQGRLDRNKAFAMETRYPGAQGYTVLDVSEDLLTAND